MISSVVLGMMFLWVAGTSASYARRSKDWPTMSQLVTTEGPKLRIVEDEDEETEDQARAA